MGASTTVAVSGAKGEANVQKVKSAASVNATLVQGSPGVVYGYDLSNSTASAKFVKFYDKATAPTVGTDVPKFTVMVPANGRAVADFDAPAKFELGIGFGITGAVGETDTTVTAADDVIGAVFYA